MKRLPMFFFVAGFSFSSSFCVADEYLTSKSPDGKFALHVSRRDKQPFPQSCEIVNAKTRQVILALDEDKVFDPEAKLVWSNDSHGAAYLTLTKEYEDDAATRVFVRNDFRFDLPRRGRTVLVRSAKTKKVLYKVTWNGEKFVQQRDAAPK